MKNRTVCAVVFGGKGEEHEISCLSAHTILDAGRDAGFEMLPVGIDKAGKWHIGDAGIELLHGRVKSENGISSEAALATLRRGHLAVVFPIIHGRGGEDGVLQGYFETCGIPYVGARVLSSAVCMDKIMQKIVCRDAGIPVTRFVWTTKDRFEQDKESLLLTLRTFHSPYFVKPSNQGSSVGISKISSLDELDQAATIAFAFDDRILIEEGVENARELEVAMLDGHNGLILSQPGEIVPNAAFYDYKTKYGEQSGAETHVPAALHPNEESDVLAIAQKTWHTLSCNGFVRADFFLSRSTGKVFLNEVNTLPGCTAHSLFPRLMEARGFPMPMVVKLLIEQAINMHAR